MGHAILLMLICSVMHAISAAQSAPEKACPSIDVIVPAGIVEPGRLETYTATVSGANQDLKYLWKLNAGEIKTGQGTRTIEILRPDSTLTVTVDIEGLPDGCPTSASDSSVYDPVPQPARVGTLYSLETGKFEKKLQEFADELAKHPVHQGYIIFGFGANTLPEVKARERKILVNLTKLMDLFDRSRFTLVRWGGKADVVELWRVPPGADNPTCESCQNAACPKIDVLGPATVTKPGHPFEFYVDLTTNSPQNLTYRWKVSKGRIIEGQGTTRIKVEVAWTTEISITATLEVGGLPEGCTTTDSETAAVTCKCQSVLIDEFGRLTIKDLRTRLAKFFTGLADSPSNQGFIILYGTEKHMTARERLIVNAINFRSYDRSRVTIVRGGAHESGRVYTKLYRIPTGADNPTP